MSPNSFAVMSLLLAGSLFSSFPVLAHEAEKGPVVAPRAERDKAQQLGMSGPKENKGIKSVKTLGANDLTGEFAGSDGLQMRARELIVEPGGVVAVHQHDRRPGVAYILEGEMVEHRNDRSGPLVRKKGHVALEKTGVVHWWENRSKRPARALVVDIIPMEKK